MSVGVLVITNRSDETADYLCSRMNESGIEYTRLDTEIAASVCSVFASPQRLELRIGDVDLPVAKVHVVWYRRPKPIGDLTGGSRYDRAFAIAEWTAALEGFLAHIPMARWVNHPSSIMGASSKLEQLARAAQYGLAVPQWLCTTNPEDALQFFHKQEGHVVVKPLYCGYIEREVPDNDTIIYTSRVRVEDLHACGPTLGAPTLFQREVLDALDVRLTIVDDAVVAVGLVGDGRDVDIRRGNMARVRYLHEHVPNDVQSALQALVRSYGLRFAAIDMMVVQGVWYFLEVNPNGQWAWLDLLGDAGVYKEFLKAFGGVS